MECKKNVSDKRNEQRETYLIVPVVQSKGKTCERERMMTSVSPADPSYELPVDHPPVPAPSCSKGSS